MLQQESVQLPAGPAFERHFSPHEIAELWGLGVDAVRRIFMHEEGVLKYGHEETNEFFRADAPARLVASSWMTTAEAAAYLKTKPRTLLKWVREGAIKGYPLHGLKRRVWRFRQEDLDAALGFIATPSGSSMLDSQMSSVVRVQ